MNQSKQKKKSYTNNTSILAFFKKRKRTKAAEDAEDAEDAEWQYVGPAHPAAYPGENPQVEADDAWVPGENTQTAATSPAAAAAAATAAVTTTSPAASPGATPATAAATSPVAAEDPLHSSSDEEMVADEPFDQPKVVFRNDEIKLTLERSKFKRQKTFRLDDFLFTGKIEVLTKGKQRPLLMSLLDALKEGIEEAIRKLQALYDIDNSDEYKQIYITLSEAGIMSGLNTGNYSLSTDPEVISTHALHLLYNYLESFKKLRLNRSFKINFLVLSLPHAKERVKKGFQLDKEGGRANVPVPQKIERTLFHIPTGFPGCEEAFHLKCMLVAIVVAYSKSKYEQGSDIQMWRKMCGLQLNHADKNSRQRKKRAGQIILKQVEELCQQTGVSLDGPHSLLHDAIKICNFLRAQLFIFSKDSGLLKRVPEKFDPKLRPLLLLRVKNGPDADAVPYHLHVIKNFKSYCKQRKVAFICIACGKVNKKKGHTHMCRQREMCYSCRRPYQLQDTFVTPATNKTVCIGRLRPEISVCCPRCNVTSFTTDCLRRHKKECHKGYRCLTCGKYTHSNSHHSTHQKIAQVHRCKESWCLDCHKSVPDVQEHLCPLSKPKYPRHWPKLGFLHFQVIDDSRANCFNCTCVGSCTKHANHEGGEPRANVCTLVVESKNVHNFSRITIMEEALGQHPIVEEDFYDFKYLPSHHLTLEAGRPKISVGCAKGTTLEERLLHWFTSNSLSDYTFLVNNATTNQMVFVLNFLILGKIKPKILMKNNKLLLIEVAELKIRFIDAQKFLQFSELDAFINLDNFHFFPENLNLPNHYKDELKTHPQETYYFLPTDSDEELGAKANFIHKVQQAPFIFKRELLINSAVRVTALTQISLTFLKESLQLQERLKKTGSNRQNVPPSCHSLLHPFSYVSNHGYLMDVFKLFCLHAPLHVVKNETTGIYAKSSIPEFQMALYLKSVYPHKNIQWAYSPYGQKKFKEAIPDIFLDNDMAYFVHGCHYHRHIDEKCPRYGRFTTNQPTDDNIEKNREDDRKIAALRFNHNIKTAVIWECEIGQRMKEDHHFRDILKSAVIPPRQRLIPRKACKYLVLHLRLDVIY